MSALLKLLSWLTALATIFWMVTLALTITPVAGFAPQEQAIMKDILFVGVVGLAVTLVLSLWAWVKK